MNQNQNFFYYSHPIQQIQQYPHFIQQNTPIYHDQQSQFHDNKPYLFNTQPVIIEKVHRQQFLIEKPVITREIVHQPFLQQAPFQQNSVFLQTNNGHSLKFPPKLKKTRSMSFMASNSYIFEQKPQEIPFAFSENKTENSVVYSENQEKTSNEKVFSLEKQINIYRNELEKAYNTLEEYKKKSNKLEFILQDYENRLKSSSENENLYFMQETEKFQMILLKKDEEIALLSQELQQKEDLKADLTKISGFLSLKIKETEECRSRLSDKETFFIEIEKKMKILMDENDHLNSLLKQKVEEVRFLNIKITEFNSFSSQNQQKNTVLSQEIDRLNAKLVENKNELDVWRNKYTEYSGLTVKIQDLLIVIVMMAGEIECLRVRIKGSELEVEEMRKSNILKSLKY